MSMIKIMSMKSPHKTHIHTQLLGFGVGVGVVVCV